MSIREQVADGWANLLSGLGVKGRDKYTAAHPVGPDYLSDEQLSNIYVGDGLGRKIIRNPSEDATREWIEITGDDEGDLSRYLNELKVKGAMRDAMNWARAYGGALVVIGVDDGREIHEPMAASWRSVNWVRVFDRRRVPISPSNYDLDINSARYGEIEHYTVYPLTGHSFNVHHTRAVQVVGDKLPDDLEQQYKGWGQPVMLSMWRDVAAVVGSFQAATNIMQELIVGKYKFVGLAEKLAAGEEKAIQRRIDIIAASKSIANAVMLDAELEDYQRDSASVAGLADILDRQMMFIAGLAEQPVSILFGRSAAGMNATGENDVREYYDKVASEQEERLREPIEGIAYLCNEAADGPNLGDYAIEFKPLWQMSDKETVDMRKTQSDTDRAYWEMGVLDVQEIRDSRFGKDKYSIETEIDTEQIDITPPEGEED